MILGFILNPLQQLLIWDKQSDSIRREQNANHSFFMRVIIVYISVFRGWPQHLNYVNCYKSNQKILLSAIKPHRVLLSEIPKVKNGHYGRESNIIEIEGYNKQLGNIASELNGTFK